MFNFWPLLAFIDLSRMWFNGYWILFLMQNEIVQAAHLEIAKDFPSIDNRCVKKSRSITSTFLAAVVWSDLSAKSLFMYVNVPSKILATLLGFWGFLVYQFRNLRVTASVVFWIILVIWGLKHDSDHTAHCWDLAWSFAQSQEWMEYLPEQLRERNSMVYVCCVGSDDNCGLESIYEYSVNSIVLRSYC